jgi:flagellar protein FlaG
MRAGANFVLVRIRLPFGSCIMRIETASAAPPGQPRTPAAAAAAPTPAATAAPGTPGAHGAPGAAEPQKSAAGDDRDLQAAVESANNAVRQMATNLQFETDQSTGKVVVRVIDSETQKVLRQMPSEEMLALSQSVNGMRGMMIHLKA